MFCAERHVLAPATGMREEVEARVCFYGGRTGKMLKRGRVAMRGQLDDVVVGGRLF